MRPEELEYHTARARMELDLGLTAGTMMASKAHLQLASMHMQRVRELSAEGAISVRPLLQM